MKDTDGMEEEREEQGWKRSLGKIDVTRTK